MKSYFRLSLFSFLIIFSASGFILPFGEEICDNALDDDNDGLIDMNDPDCACFAKLAAPLDNIPNPSFEESLCIPQTLNQLFCLVDWEQPSPATTDYYHAEGFLPTEILTPLPLPDGDGFIGFGNYYNPANTDFSIQKEYLATCLNSKFEAGKTYQLTFFVGFGESIATTPEATSFSPMTIALFGTSDCGEIPFSTSSYECPVGFGNWVELGIDTIVGENEWVKTNITFTPAIDIYGISIGPDCVELPSQNNLFAYHLMDGFRVGEVKSDLEATGHPCTEDFMFNTTIIQEGITYQWYKNGIAIVGEQNELLRNFEQYDSSDVYQLRIDYEGGGCAMSDTSYLPAFTYPAILFTDIATANCEGRGGVVSTQIDGGEAPFIYEWSDASNDSSLDDVDAGVYILTVTDELGCMDIDTVDVTLSVSIDSIYSIPNIFTPNGDGVNDIFKIYVEEKYRPAIEIITFKVFNRWGETVYESKDITQIWDGYFKGKPAQSDTYIYRLEMKLVCEDKVAFESGEITLLR